MNVSILLVRGVVSELRSRGIAAHSVLLGTGIDEGRLSDLSASVSLGEWEVLTRRAQELSRDPFLGAAVGEHLPLAALHWLNLLLRSAETLREAIAIASRYQHLLTEHLSFSLHEQGDEARLVCTSLIEGDAARCAFEVVIGVALRMGASLTPRRAGSRVSVRWSAAPSAHVPNYASYWGCPVQYGASETAIVFPRALLDEARGAYADNPLLDTARDYAERLFAAQAQRALSVRVQALLSREADLSQFEVGRVASVFGLNERTFRRKLAEEGKPLADILAVVRREHALREMRDPNIAIKELSERLGFSEPSAFHRAFKRWTGRTPTEYIREHAPSSRVREKPGHDARGDASGLFKVHEMPKTSQLLHDHA